MKNELILINENSEQAQASIENWKLRAKQTTDLIKYFNQIPLLSEIKTEAQLLDFLKNPVSYLNTRIMMDIKFSAKVQPPPSGVAELYQIPYKDIVQRLDTCQVTDLLHMVFDEATQVVSFDQGCEEKIQKAFYEYARDKQESDLIVEIRKAAQDLNGLAERLDLGCNELKFFKSRVKEGGQGYEFCENLRYLRERLEYEKNLNL